MPQISVTLVRADTNQEFDVELPDDAPISDLLPALVKELGLPLTGPDGNQVAYELSNKRTGREYKEADSLGSASTKLGDSLLLTSTFVAGGNVSRMAGNPVALTNKCVCCDVIRVTNLSIWHRFPHEDNAELCDRCYQAFVKLRTSKACPSFQSCIDAIKEAQCQTS